MNNKELQNLDEALNYLNEESIESLLEFNIKDTLDSIIEKIKKAIVRLIDKANEALSKCKDSKVKSTIKGILDKAKKLLTKSDNITTEKQANEISEEVKELSAQIKSPGITPEFIEAVKANKKLRVHIMIGDAFLIFKDNFNYVDEMIAYDISINGVDESKYKTEDIPTKNIDNMNDKSEIEDTLNTCIVMFKQDNGYNRALERTIQRLIEKM